MREQTRPVALASMSPVLAFSTSGSVRALTTCTVRPSVLGSPANAHAVDYEYDTGTTFIDYLLELAEFTLDEAISADGKCKQIAEQPLDDFFSPAAETQDAFLDAFLGYIGGRYPERLPPERAAGDVDGIFVVARAPSRINSDNALFIAAAKPNKHPQRLNWQLFRIQLTHVADGGHFCTPSANATVLDPIVGVSEGRLYVAFNSFEGSTTTGSILDFDVRSLVRGGPAEVKCFTGTDLKNLVPPDVRDASQNAYFLGLSALDHVTRFKLKVVHSVANDTLAATPDIAVPGFDFNPAAIQPKGFHLYSGGFGFQGPSIQFGESLWNVHQIGDAAGHEKVRLYKFGASATSPDMTLTLATLADQSDDTFAPSIEIDTTAVDLEAFVTFTRTIAADSVNGKATVMLARGPSSSTSGWTSTVLAASKGQFTKGIFGSPCDSFTYGGCNYGPTSATVIDRINNLVWGFGEIITTDSLGIGGKGNEVNWVVKGVSVPR